MRDLPQEQEVLEECSNHGKLELENTANIPFIEFSELSTSSGWEFLQL